jgi:hypothetical protein
MSQGEEMSWEKPSWYMTTDEFADLVVHSLEVTHHFKRGESAHPEDIVAAFVTAAETIGIGAGAAGKKMWAAEKKAVMNTGDLSKVQDSESQDGSLDYSEWKHNQ